jgi:hypothetical protein
MTPSINSGEWGAGSEQLNAVPSVRAMVVLNRSRRYSV